MDTLELKERNRTFTTVEEAEVELQRLSALGYRDRGYDSTGNADLKVDFVRDYRTANEDYFVAYSEPVGEQSFGSSTLNNV